MQNKLLIFFLIIAAFGCKEVKRSSQGALGLVLVVMDSTKWESATGIAIQETFAQVERTVPQPEPLYELQFYSISKPADIAFVKKQRNVIIAAPLGEQTNTGRWVEALISEDVRAKVQNGNFFAFPLNDRWAINQWALLLSGPSDSVLAQKIYDAQDGLIAGLDERERSRQIFELFRHGERNDLSDSLWTTQGFKLRIQMDFQKNVDTLRFISFNRMQQDNMRWFWISWIDNFVEPEKISAGFVNALRDSLNQTYVRGTRDSSFVTTEYRLPVKSAVISVNGRYAMETKGVWRMENDLMGGPFLNYTIYDEYQHRLYLIEFSQFAPKYKKLRFVRQFEAMGRSFVSDTTRKPFAG